MANATDDLSQLFNDDLLGMDAGVGDAAAEEKAREALSSAMMADMAQERGVPLPRDDNRQGARGRNLGQAPPGGLLGGGNPMGGDRRGHGAGARAVGRVMPGPHLGPGPGGRDGPRTPPLPRAPPGSDDFHDDLSFDEHAHHDLDGEDEIEQQEWPSPAELLADARAILASADAAVMRDGKPPPPEHMARLDRELHRIVRQRRATPQDDQKRQNLLRRFDALLARKFPGVALKPFGSFVSVFHTAGSDIDISLEVSPTSNWYDPKEMGRDAAANGRGRNRRQQQPRGYKSRKVQLLSKVASELRYQRFADVNLVAHARVPLIKFRDPHTGVNCDVCVGNDGVYKSAVLGTMANLDSRYRDLVFLVKMWAKHFDCNDAMAGSFNSFALSLMSLFHLQTRSPPILPPCLRMTLASEAAADADLAAENERAANLEPIRKFPVSKIRQQSDALRDVGPVEQRARRWQGCGSKNNATLAELLVTFFTHFRAVEPLWRHGLVASTYAGRWVAGCSWPPGRYCLGVEDPFSAGDNVARAVQRRSLPKVLSAVRDGTLAVGRVVWAESDEDLERALYDLLGPGALPPQEVPQQGWPTLGGGGAVENILGGGGDAAGGATGGPRPPPGTPPGPGASAGLNPGLLNLITGGLGAGGGNPLDPANGMMQTFAQPPHTRANQGFGLAGGLGPSGGSGNLESIFGPANGGGGGGGGGGGAPPGFGQSSPLDARGAPPGFGAAPAPRGFSFGNGPAPGPQQTHGVGVGGIGPFSTVPSLFGGGGGAPGAAPGVGGGVDALFGQMRLGGGLSQPAPQPHSLAQIEARQHAQSQGAIGVGGFSQGSGAFPDAAGKTPDGGGVGGDARAATTSPAEEGSGGGRGGRRGRRGGDRGGGGGGRAQGKFRGGGGGGKADAPSAGPKTLPKPRVAPPT